MWPAATPVRGGDLPHPTRCLQSQVGQVIGAVATVGPQAADTKIPGTRIVESLPEVHHPVLRFRWSQAAFEDVSLIVGQHVLVEAPR